MTKIKFAILSSLFAIAFHTYLFLNYYPLKFARATGDSLCNINSTFNCDAVAASSFSSFFGIPMATWGAATNLVLLTFLLILGFRLTDDHKKTLRYTTYLATFIALMSILMGGVSLFMIGTYCLFCIGTYITSFLTFFALWKAKDEPLIPQFLPDIKDLFTNSKVILVGVLAIPALSLLVDQSMKEQYGANNFDRIVKSSILDWRSNPKVTFDQQPLITLGADAEKAKMTIVEFADFLCPHCKHASPTVQAFVTSHPEVRFEFYVFPLDGTCNPAIERKNGFSCFLSKTVYCAEKQGAGTYFYNLIFKKQENFSSLGSVENFKNALIKWSTTQKIDWKLMQTCLDGEDAHKAMTRMGQLGSQSGVQGTPTFFVNGQLLQRAQLLPILKAALDSLK